MRKIVFRVMLELQEGWFLVLSADTYEAAEKWISESELPGALRIEKQWTRQ